MPAFYPQTAPHYFSQSSGHHGNGYKDACYHALNDYPNGFNDYHDARSQEVGPVLPDPYDRFAKGSLVNHPSNMYANSYVPKQPYMGAPAMPPMHVYNEPFYDHQNGLVASNAHDNVSFSQNVYNMNKEEKAVGGVSATLDYEMEQMTDFVAETTFGIYELCASRICVADIDLLRSVRPSFGLPSSFRKWVLQVLHATRLPSATILLSLAFLAQRVRQQSANGTFDPSEIALYRTLTVSLILGSKFLDDNTFQNKSWAEVSHIHVADLNKAERDWLMAFEHRLHQNPERSDGFRSCEQLWASFQLRHTKLPAQVTALKPIDTNVWGQQRQSQRPSPANFQQPLNKPTPIDSALADSHYRTQMYAFDPWSSHSASPASAQTSGPHTPEYYGGHAVWGNSPAYGHWDAWSANSYSANHTPYPKYGCHPLNSYAQGPCAQGQIWGNCHGSACQCATCRTHANAPLHGPMVAG